MRRCSAGAGGRPRRRGSGPLRAGRAALAAYCGPWQPTARPPLDRPSHGGPAGFCARLSFASSHHAPVTAHGYSSSQPPRPAGCGPSRLRLPPSLGPPPPLAPRPSPSPTASASQSLPRTTSPALPSSSLPPSGPGSRAAASASVGGSRDPPGRGSTPAASGSRDPPPSLSRPAPPGEARPVRSCAAARARRHSGPRGIRAEGAWRRRRPCGHGPWRPTRSGRRGVLGPGSQTARAMTRAGPEPAWAQL